jgi:hypothetical protein
METIKDIEGITGATERVGACHPASESNGVLFCPDVLDATASGCIP